MFIALKPRTESSRVGPPIQHAPGDVLERWAEWPYRVRVALLHAEMAEERDDVIRETSVTDAPDPASVLPTFNCEQCDRTFQTAPALKRHQTRTHR